MSSASARLGLLLAVDRHPALEEGLDRDDAGKAPRLAAGPRGMDGLSLEAPDADPNDLPLQRWGVIAPEGPEGDAMLEAIQPLLALREGEQGAKPKQYRVPADMDLELSLKWKNAVLRDEDVPEAERPKYLLVLGDLDRASAELQHVLTNGSYVGRLAFATSEGYARYARKAVRWAKAPASAEKPDALFFGADDGTLATQIGREALVERCLKMARDEVAKASSSSRRRFQFQANAVEQLDGELEAAGFCAATARGATPSVLLSMSHGAGWSRSKFKPAKRRAEQGALVLGDRYLTSDLVEGKPFLPGGFWFCVACFGAGTPRASAFHPWLSQLSQLDAYQDRLAEVLACLPDEHERPFIAALPQAVLEKDDGPLAFLGHLDLAWTYAFTEGDGSRQSRAGRIFSSLQAATRGSRAGVVHDALMRSYREVNDELTAGYQAEQDARVMKRTYQPDLLRRGHAFMLRNDLRGYILLGDPAARLPIQGTAAGEAAPAPSTALVSSPTAPVTLSSSASGRDPEQMEKAVLAMLRGDESPRAIAARHGVGRDEIDRWVDQYREAGRERLAKLR